MPGILVVNLILDVTILSVGMLIVSPNVCGMSYTQVIPFFDIVSFHFILETVFTRNDGFHVVHLTNTYHIREFKGLTRFNDAILPAETQTAVIDSAVLNHVVINIG